MRARAAMALAMTLDMCAASSIGGSNDSSLHFAGKRLDSLSATNKLTAAGTTSPTIHQNQTLVVLFWWAPGAPVTLVTGLWGSLNTSPLKGWIFQFYHAVPADKFAFTVLNGTTTQAYTMGAPVQGLNCIVLTRTAGDHIRSSMNGGAVVDAAMTLSPILADPDAPAIHSIGGTNGGNQGYVVGGFLHGVGLNRLATDAELVAWSGTVYPSQPASRFALPASLTSDPAVTFDWLASRDWDGVAGTSTSQGSAPCTFTVAGSPVLTAMSEQYTTNLSASFVDTGPVTSVPAPVGSGSYWKTNVLARMRVAVPVTQPQIAIGYINDSGAENAFEKVPVYLNGSWLVDAPPTVTQTAIALQWVQLAAFNAAMPSGNVEVWQPLRSDAALSGNPIGGHIASLVTAASPVFTITKPVKRLVMYGDSRTCGYLANTAGSGLIANLRADFPTSGGPGGVTAEAYGGRNLFVDAGGIAGPGIPALAATLVAECQNCTGGVSGPLVIWIGINDVGKAWTAAQFGVVLQMLIDAVTALDATIPIFLLNDPQGSAFQAQYAARTGCTKVDLTGRGITFVDGLHPTAAGDAIIKGAVKTAIGY